MKYLAILLLLTGGFVLRGFAQDFEAALAKGDVETISKYLDQSTEICFRDEIDFYDKNQASTFLRKFFANNKPLAYKHMHKGSSKGNSHYTIGSLSTDKGMYRVYLYFRKDADLVRIREIRFDQQKG